MTKKALYDDAAEYDDVIKRHIFGIGVATYREGWERLPQVPGDVAAVIDALARFGYRPARPHRRGLINPPSATHIQEQLLSWVEAEELGDDDMVAVYHAGHGENEDEHFLVCSQTDRGLAPMMVSALPTSRLVRLLGAAGIHRLLLILDTCYAGDGAAEAMALAATDQLVTAAAFPVEHRRHWRSLEVLAAARPGETARDGLFAQVMVSVLRDELADNRILAGERPPYVRLSDVVREVNRVFERRGIPQRADHAQIRDDGIGFLPNPRYVAQLPEGQDLAEQHTFSAQYRLRVIERAEHFGPRARGVHAPGEAGHYFTGRTKVLTRLARWLRGSDEESVRVFQVTGGPGTGKSSVLGRVVALSDRAMRVGIPDSTVLLSTDVPIGVIDLAIHAAHRTTAEVLAAMGDALGVTSDEPDVLIKALQARPRPFTVVIDALDEIGISGEQSYLREIMAFLQHASARAPRLRLLLGGRNHVFSRYPVSGSVARVDLDEPEWIQHGDLVAYAAELLASPHGPGSETGIADRLVTRAAAEIAGIAGRNYLIIRLIARSLADPGQGFWRTDPSQWPRLLPALGDVAASSAEAIGGAFRWAMDTQVGVAEGVRARALLSPLAYARGAGLPLALVWPAAARAFASQPVTEYDLTQLLATDAAAPYVVEALDAHGRSVYRLYHQALADDLQRQTETNGSQPTAAADDRGRRRKDLLASLFDHLYGAAPRASDGARDWHHADPYLLEQLPAYAADADRVHVLLNDAGFLLYVEPAALIPVLDLAKTPAGRLAATIYRSCVEQLRGADPGIRRWALAANAARHGATEFKERLRSVSVTEPAGLWPRWSTGSPQPALRNTMVGSISPVEAISCTILDDRPVAVTASFDPAVRVWDLSSGQLMGPPLEGHTKELRAVACSVLDGRPIAVTGGMDRTVRVWDLARGEQVGRALTENDGFVLAVACAMVGTSPVAVSGGGHAGVLQAWDLTRTRLTGRGFEKGKGWLTALDCGVLEGRPIVVGGYDSGIVQVWDLESRELLHDPIDEYSWAGRVETVACTMVNGLPVVIIVNAGQSRHSVVWAWDLTRRREMGRPFRNNSYVESATSALINDRPAVVTVGYDDGVIEAWDLASHGRIGRPIQGPREGAETVTATVLDGRPVAITGSHDNLMQVWDLSRHRKTGQSLPGHNSAIVALSCTERNGSPIAVTAGADSTMRIWDLADGRQAAVLPTGQNRITSLSCVAAPGGSHFAVAANTFQHSKASVWDLSRHEQIDELADGIDAIATSVLAGRAVAITSGRQGVQIWDIARGEQIGVLPAENAPTLLECTTTQAGQVIAVGCTGSAIWQWDLGRQVQIAQPVRHYARTPTEMACAWEDDRAIAVTVHTEVDRGSMGSGTFEIYNGEVRLWDLTHGKLIGEHFTPSGDSPNSVACTQYQGRTVAISGGMDRTLRMWDVTSNRLVRKWPVHGEIHAVCRSTDGALVSCIGSDIQVADFN